MAETESSAPHVGHAANGPTGAVPIQILTQYLKDLSFESPGGPVMLAAVAKTPPSVQANVNLSTAQLQATEPDAPAPYECTLTIKVEGRLGDGDNAATAFITEISYAGLFAFPAGLPHDLMRLLLMVEAPRLLFPFARVLVSDTVQQGGFGPLLLNPIDFGALYQQQLQYEAQAAQQQSGTA